MYKLFKFTLDFCLFGIFFGMFIAEEFYDVKMIERLKLLDQILSSSPPLNTVDDCLSKNKPFFSPQSPSCFLCCFYGHDETNEKHICSSELIMYKLAYGFSLHFSRTLYECFVCMDGRPQRVCPLVCMIHKPKHPES